MQKTVLIEVDILDTEEISPGVFRTGLTNPKLEGELFFIHGINNKGITLSSIRESFLGDVTEIVSLIGDLTNGKGNGKTAIPSPNVGSASLDTYKR